MTSAWHQTVSSSIFAAANSFQSHGHGLAALADQHTISQSCASCPQTLPVDQNGSGLDVNRVGLMQGNVPAVTAI